MGPEARVGYENGRFGLRASGAGIQPATSEDEHLFVYRKERGEMGITARVVSADNCGARASFGVIVRPTLDGDSGYVLSAAQGSKGVAQQGRVFQGGVSIPLRLDSGMPLPIWLRVERRGFSLLAALSMDGSKWETRTIASPFPPDIYLGLVAASHDAGRTCSAVFDNVTTSAAMLPLPQITQTEIPDAGMPAMGMPMMADAGPGRGPPDAGVAEDGGAGSDPDAGGSDAQPPDARPPAMPQMPQMRCNQLLPVGVDPVSRTIADYSPFPSGGDIKEGIYFRVGGETYTGPGGPSSMPQDAGAMPGGGGPGRFVQRTTIAVSKVDERTYTVEAINFVQLPQGTNSSFSNQKWTRKGSSLATASSCPGMSDEVISGYAMNDNDLLLFSVFRQPSGAPAVNVTRYTFQPDIKHNGVGQPPTVPDAGAPAEPDAAVP